MAIKPAEAISDGIDIDIDAEVFEGLGPSDVIEETLELSTNDVLRGQVTPFEGDALDVEIINPNGVMLYEAEDIQEVQEIALIAAGPGDYTVRVSNPGFTPVLIGDISVEGITPFEVYDVVGPADESFQRDALSAGDREVMVFRFLSDDMVGVDLDVDDGEATLRVLDPVTQEIIGESDDPDELSLGVSGDFGEQRVLEVVADSDLGEGYELSLSELNEFEVEVTSEPALAIPDNDAAGVTDELNVSSCPTILEVAVELDITHTWRGDLIVDVTTPAGEVARLHDRTGGSSDDIQATYPFPDGTGLDDGEELLDFEGTSGTGIWEIFVSDNAFSDTGDLNSWTLTLTCEG